MPIAVGVEILKIDLEDAYIKAKDDGSADGADAGEVISNLAQDVADSVHKYMETAQVITTHDIDTGQSAASAIPIASGPGVVVSPGTGNGPAGTLSFTSNADLKTEVEDAYIKAKDDGSAGGADPVLIITDLSDGISQAVHKFALTGIVETDIIVDPGASVSGYLGPPPGSAPVPAFTVAPGNGKGIGNLL